MTPDATLEFTLLTEALLPTCAALAAQAPDPWGEGSLLRAMQNSHQRVFVALRGGTPVAFACFLFVADSCDLQQLVVHAIARRQGIAVALLRHSLAEMAALGPTRCLLEVRCQNAPAIALYTRLGFRQLALRPGMYQNPPDDGLLMAKTLTGK